MTSILRKLCWGACLTLNILLCCTFTFQFNSLVMASFENRGYQQEIQKLSMKNEELNLDLLQTNKLDKVEILAQKLNFEKSQDAEYIRSFSAEVASRAQ